MFSATSFLFTSLAYLGLVAAQTYTSCNPLQKTCPSNPGLTSRTLTTDFTAGASSNWVVLNASSIGYSSAGVGFTVKGKGDGPTLGSNFYMLFGYVEVKMMAAPGTGIVSAIVLQSDDLDEIDWEIIGSSPNSVQTNFFGKGNTQTYDRGQTHGVSASTTTYHTYGIEWTSSAITWSIDGTVVRTLSSTDSSTLNGKNFPQSPCQIRIGNWAAGASPNPGTVSWAGGATDFSKGPFSMYVSSVSVVNYNPASSYTYGDNSGSWQSIKVTGGSSVVTNGKSGPVNVDTSAANSTSSTMSTATATSSTRASTSSAPANSTMTGLSTVRTTTSVSSLASAATSVVASASASASATNGASQQTVNSIKNSILVAAVLTALGTFWL